MQLSSYNTALDTPRLQEQSIDYPRSIQGNDESHQIQDSHNEVRDADLIELFHTNILPRWQQKYKLSDTSIQALHFTVNNFLDDSKFLRIACAMSNEVAFAIEESMQQWKFPKWLSNTLYYGLWAAALGSSAARVVLRGLGTGNIKTFLETAVQDTVAAFIGPTGIIMVADKVQNMIYKNTKLLPQSLVNFIRPALSVFLAEKSIVKILDPIGKSLGRMLTGIISPEKYKKWSELISNKLQTFFHTHD